MKNIISSDGFVNTNYSKFEDEPSNVSFEGVNGVSKNLKKYIPMVLSLRIKDPPDDLVLLINPSSFSHNLTKKITPTKTRADSFSSGYVVQFARDELDSIQADGMIAMMYHSKHGLCSTDMLSESYDYFNKLLAFYDNNGVNFNSKFFPIIDSIGRVVISYDGFEYYGCFDDFSYKQTANDPFNFSFSWSFTVSSFVNSNQNLSFDEIKSQPNLKLLKKIEASQPVKSIVRLDNVPDDIVVQIEEVAKNPLLQKFTYSPTDSVMNTIKANDSIVALPKELKQPKPAWELSQDRSTVQHLRLQNYQKINSPLFQQLNSVNSTAFIRDANIFSVPKTKTTQQIAGVKKTVSTG